MGVHTEGPLIARDNCGDGQTLGVMHGPHFIPLGHTSAVRSPAALHGRTPIEAAEAKANARLWSAAADLLAAAVVAEDLIDDMTTPGREHEDPELYAALKALRAAIASALGQDGSAS